MRQFSALWRKLTQNKALENVSSELEHSFFELFHRVSYLFGISSANEGWCHLLYSYGIKILMALFICAEIIAMFTIVSTLDEAVAVLSYLVMQNVTIYRHRNVVTHMKRYKNQGLDISQQLDIKTHKRRMIADYWANKNNTDFKFLISLGVVTLFAWFLFPLVDNVECNMVVDIWLPFDHCKPNIYIYTYIPVSIIFGFIAFHIMMADLNLQSHLLYIVCQFNILTDCLETIFDDYEVPATYKPDLKSNMELELNCRKHLGILVEQHKILLRLVLDLRNSLSGPMLGQLVGSGVLFCFVAFQATTTIGESAAQGLMNISFLGYNLVEFFIMCRWCEEITRKSQDIGLAAYRSGWECGSGLMPTIRSSLMLIIARANKPLVLTAGGMYNLSLESYTSLLKTSYSALTVLLQFKQS